MNALHGRKTKRMEKKLDGENAASNTEYVLEASTHKIGVVRPRTTHHENYPS